MIFVIVAVEGLVLLCHGLQPVSQTTQTLVINVQWPVVFSGAMCVLRFAPMRQSVFYINFQTSRKRYRHQVLRYLCHLRSTINQAHLPTFRFSSSSIEA